MYGRSTGNWFQLFDLSEVSLSENQKTIINRIFARYVRTKIPWNFTIEKFFRIDNSKFAWIINIMSLSLNKIQLL